MVYTMTTILPITCKERSFNLMSFATNCPKLESNSMTNSSQRESYSQREKHIFLNLLFETKTALAQSYYLIGPPERPILRLMEFNHKK